MDSEWQRTGGTLSDKTARKEFGLTQEEIVAAIRTGKLHYHMGTARTGQARVRAAARQSMSSTLPVASASGTG
jgi:hypothetical protein